MDYGTLDEKDLSTPDLHLTHTDTGIVGIQLIN